MENRDYQKRVAAIHDLSGFGKCSLTVALPILSAIYLPSHLPFGMGNLHMLHLILYNKQFLLSIEM